MTSLAAKSVGKCVQLEMKGTIAREEGEIGYWGTIFFLIYIYIHIYFLIYLFIHLFLAVWVFVSVRGLSLVAASGGHSSSWCAGL